ncbi:MAG: hypothetical protein KGO00_02065 [Bacteroidetes bacterium]|nr:hypothetical protein [Bacteroidota bacterium]
MRIFLLMAILWTSLFDVAAQNKTGVWYGAIVFEPDGFREMDTESRIKVDAQAGRIINVPPIYAGSMSLSKSGTFIKAKLEIIDTANQMMAVLTTFSADQKKLSAYLFYLSATPTQKYNYYGKAVRCLVNETDHTPSLFDIHGNFNFTDSSITFSGIWESPFGKSMLGKFSFQPSMQTVSINPELLIDWNDALHVLPAITQIENFIPSTINYDTLLTRSFYIDFSITETGVLDHDTLSVWLDGQLLEDHLVLTDKKHDFRVNITSKDYHQLTIRTNSEGAIAGNGYLLSIATKENVYKYNIVQYRYNQSDWFFHKVGSRERSN